MTDQEIQFTEDRIQGDCFQWFNNNNPALRGLLYHVPNGGLRDPITANKLKAMGVVKGIPDLVFHFWARSYFLECKTPEGVVSPDQKKIHKILEQHGFTVFVFRSLQEFQQIIFDIFSDHSTRLMIGLTKAEYYYRHKVFNYIYELRAGAVTMIEDLCEEETAPKFRGYLHEFITDYYDKQEGFEVLFTEDLKGFYKKLLVEDNSILYNGTDYIEIPPAV